MNINDTPKKKKKELGLVWKELGVANQFKGANPLALTWKEECLKYDIIIIWLAYCYLFLWALFCPLISLFGLLDDIVLLSTLPVVVKGGNALHNEYVVGLCDAEATFTISVTKDNRTRKSSRSLDNSRTIYSFHPSFAVWPPPLWGDLFL
jgi:hypothetical protein